MHRDSLLCASLGRGLLTCALGANDTRCGFGTVVPWHWTADWCYHCSAYYQMKWAKTQPKSSQWWELCLYLWPLAFGVSSGCYDKCWQLCWASHHSEREAAGFGENYAEESNSHAHFLLHHLYKPVLCMEPLSCAAVDDQHGKWAGEVATPLSIDTCCVTYLIYSFSAAITAVCSQACLRLLTLARCCTASPSLGVVRCLY